MNRDYPDSMLTCNTSSDWQAAWIWYAGSTDAAEEYAVFRQTVSLPENLENPVLKITAAGSFCLKINGKTVEYGAALCDPQFQRYNVIPVKEFLHTGKNTVAVLVHHDSHRQIPHQEYKGLLCQLENDGNILLISDKQWKAARHNSYQITAVPYDSVSFQEHFDGRKFPGNWDMEDFDDSSWENAVNVIPEKNLLWNNPLPQNRFFPWVNLIPQETQPAVRREIVPCKITFGEVIQHTEFSFYDIAVRNSLENVLAANKCRINCQAGKYTIQNSDLQESDETFDGLHNAVLILDFGKLLNGRMKFRTDAPAGCAVEITYAETLEDDKVISCRSTAAMFADAFITGGGKEKFTTFNWRHFRYVRLTFRNLKEKLIIDSLTAEELQHNFPAQQEWDSDNGLLNKCLQATCNTINLCVSDRMMDNPSRERKQYAGDGSGMVNAIDHLYGETALVKKYFHQFDESQHRTGLYRYSTCHDNDGASLFDHSLYLPIRLYEHTMRFGDLELVENMMPGICRFMKLTVSILDSNGIAGMPPYGLWFDWANIGRKPKSFLLNAMCGKALECSAELALMLNPASSDAQYWNKLAKNIFSYLQKNFYNEKRRAFVDYLNEEDPADIPVSEHSNSLAILWDIADAGQCRDILQHYAENQRDFSPASPAWSFLLEALVKGGRTDLFFNCLKRRYAPLFAENRDTLPETWCRYAENTPGFWRCRNNRSITQGTGLGLPDAVIRGIAGITPLSCGFRKVRIMPGPGDLNFFTISIPAPDGKYLMKFNRNENQLCYQLNFPKKKSGDFVFQYSPGMDVLFNGSPVETSPLAEPGCRANLRYIKWQGEKFEIIINQKQ